MMLFVDEEDLRSGVLEAESLGAPSSPWERPCGTTNSTLTGTYARVPAFAGDGHAFV